VKAIEQLIENPIDRKMMAHKNIEEVKSYSWKNTSRETFEFIVEVYNKNK